MHAINGPALVSHTVTTSIWPIELISRAIKTPTIHRNPSAQRKLNEHNIYTWQDLAPSKSSGWWLIRPDQHQCHEIMDNSHAGTKQIPHPNSILFIHFMLSRHMLGLICQLDAGLIIIGILWAPPIYHYNDISMRYFSLATHIRHIWSTTHLNGININAV